MFNPHRSPVYKRLAELAKRDSNINLNNETHKYVLNYVEYRIRQFVRPGNITDLNKWFDWIFPDIPMVVIKTTLIEAGKKERRWESLGGGQIIIPLDGKSRISLCAQQLRDFWKFSMYYKSIRWWNKTNSWKRRIVAAFGGSVGVTTIAAIFNILTDLPSVWKLVDAIFK